MRHTTTTITSRQFIKNIRKNILRKPTYNTFKNKTTILRNEVFTSLLLQYIHTLKTSGLNLTQIRLNRNPDPGQNSG